MVEMSSDDFETDPLTITPRNRVYNFFYRQRRFLAGLLFVLAISVSVVLAVVLSLGLHQSAPPTNLIIMLGDGFGPASASLARAYLNYSNTRDRLYLDDFLIGSIQTASLDSRITDSAAGATSYACGLRTFNDVVSVQYNGKACGTLLEAAKKSGRRVGLVAKSTVSNASPAAFSSHSYFRKHEQFIAGQQVAMGVDVMIGGGYDVFNFPYGGLPSPWEQAKKKGYTLATDLHSVQDSTVVLPMMALLSGGQMDYVIDNATQPSLSQMAMFAAKTLQRYAEKEGKGFVLFVEGSLIDLAGHANDASTQVRETQDYDDAFEALRQWSQQYSPTTVIVSLADHATGGLALGRNFPGPEYPVPYQFHLRPMADAKCSMARLAKRLVANPNLPLVETINASLGFVVTPQEATDLTQWRQKGDTERLEREMGALQARLDLWGWTTWGHDAVDVNLYCAGDLCRSAPWWGRGSIRNDELGRMMAQFLDLEDLQRQVTQDLQTFNTTGHNNGWLGGNQYRSGVYEDPHK